MAFLRAHYEKILLGGSLIGMLAACYVLFTGMEAVAKDVEAIERMAMSVMSQGGLLDPISPASFPPRETLLPRSSVKLCTSGKHTSGELLAPAAYTRCANNKCPYLMPYTATVCPYCKTAQPSPAPPPPSVDTDRDGIPDSVEAAVAFLDEMNPADALEDHDGDMFLNVEEYLAQTAMDGPKSYPPLAMNLRCLKIVREQLPVILERINPNDSKDPREWDIICTVLEDGQVVTKSLKIGTRAAGFEIVKAVHPIRRIRHHGRARRMPSTLTVRDLATNEEYVLVAQRKAYRGKLKVRFVFLTDRHNLRRCRTFEAQQGDEFSLEHPVTGEVQMYKLTDIRSTSVHVTRTDASAGQHVVQLFSASRDRLTPPAKPMARREN